MLTFKNRVFSKNDINDDYTYSPYLQTSVMKNNIFIYIYILGCKELCDNLNSQGLKVIKLFHAHLCMKLILLINVKMPTIDGILNTYLQDNT